MKVADGWVVAKGAGGNLGKPAPAEPCPKLFVFNALHPSLVTSHPSPGSHLFTSFCCGLTHSTERPSRIRVYMMDPETAEVRSDMSQGKKRRWSSRARMILTIELAIVLPAAAASFTLLTVSV